MNGSQHPLHNLLPIIVLFGLFIMVGINVCWFLSSLFTIQTLDANPKLNKSKKLLIKIMHWIQLILGGIVFFQLFVLIMRVLGSMM